MQKLIKITLSKVKGWDLKKKPSRDNRCESAKKPSRNALFQNVVVPQALHHSVNAQNALNACFISLMCLKHTSMG